MRTGLSLILAAVLAACAPAPPLPSTKETSESPNEPQSKNLPIEDPVGVWAVRDENGQPFDLVLFSNGQAVSTSIRGPARARGLRGFWRSDGLVITTFLANGWTHRLYRDSVGFHYTAHAPGLLGKEPSHSAQAARVGGPEAAFSGIWRLNKEPDGSYLYIALDSSGAAFSTVAGLTEGRWEMINGAARCTWPDGWVDQISVAGSGWEKKSWVGGDESTPADLSEAVRVGMEPFEIAP